MNPEPIRSLLNGLVSCNMAACQETLALEGTRPIAAEVIRLEMLWG
jgi:hypothetical protein